MGALTGNAEAGETLEDKFAAFEEFLEGYGK